MSNSNLIRRVAIRSVIYLVSITALSAFAAWFFTKPWFFPVLLGLLVLTMVVGVAYEQERERSQ
jgi:fatty acid desaturase